MPQTLCLNMIVKDESPIIEETLKLLVSKLKFDYWVISDTGSTDGTQEIIKNFFQKQGIDGILTQDEWVDFGHNRTVALNHAFGKTDYLLIFDADDSIYGNIVIPENLDKDIYQLYFGSPVGRTFVRSVLVNNKKKWRYRCVLHEYIEAMEPCTYGSLEGDYHIIARSAGNRSKQKNKYLNDAITLEKAFREETSKGGDLVNRYAFYCANSYKDCGIYEKASEWYKNVINLNGWTQEKYFSCIKIFEFNPVPENIHYLIHASKYDVYRAEAIEYLVKYYLKEE